MRPAAFIEAEKLKTGASAGEQAMLDSWTSSLLAALLTGPEGDDSPERTGLRMMLERGDLVVGGLRWPVINARTKVVEGFAITLDYGLMSFFLNAASIVLKEAIRLEWPIGLYWDRTAEKEGPVEEAAERMACLLSWTVKAGHVVGTVDPDWVDQRTAKEASELAVRTSEFFLAHELGHVLVHGDNFQGTREEEVAADRAGCRLFKGNRSAGISQEDARRYASIELAMWVWWLLESRSVAIVDHSDKHPLAMERLSHIRTWLKEEWAKGDVELEAVAWVAEAWQVLFEKVEEFLRFGTRNGEAEFMRLLKAAVANGFSNHQMFSKPGTDIARRLTADALHALVSNVTLQATEWLKDSRSPWHVRRPDYAKLGWNPVLAWNVLDSWVSSQSEPIRRLLTDAVMIRW